MSKKVNLTVSIIAVAVAAIGGGGYFVYSSMNQRENTIAEQMDKFSKNLPPQFKFQKVSGESGLLSSTGSYRLSYINPVDKKYNGDLNITYEANHGIGSLFSGEVEFTGTTKLDGGLASLLKIKTADGNLTKIVGKIDSNGSLFLQNNSGELSFVIPVNNSEIRVKLKPASSTVNYSSETGDILNLISVPEMKIEDGSDASIVFNIKNSELKYSGKINKLQFGTSAIKVGTLEFPNSQVKIEGISVNHSADEKNKKPVLKFDSKISKINTPNYKDANFELKYSVENFDKDLFAVYQSLPFIGLTNKKVYDHKSFVSGMNKGLLVNIEKLLFKSASEKVELNGKYEITPTVEGKTFSLADQTNIELNVNADLAVLQKVLGDSTPAPEEGADKNSLNIVANYSAQLLKINGNNAQDALNSAVIDLFNQLEKENGLTVVKEAPETKAVADVKVEEKKDVQPVQAEVKQEVKVEINADVKSESK